MRAAYEMLAEVSMIQGDLIFVRVIEFATACLSKDDWLNQYIGMCTLGSAVKVPNPQLIFTHCNQLWNGIFVLLGQTQSSRLRQACAYVITQLIKACP